MLHKEKIHNCTFHQMLYENGLIKMGGTCSTYKRWAIRIKCWSESTEERKPLKILGVDGTITLKRI
jgi:hypothetical protein